MLYTSFSVIRLSAFNYFKNEVTVFLFFFKLMEEIETRPSEVIPADFDIGASREVGCRGAAHGVHGPHREANAHMQAHGMHVASSDNLHAHEDIRKDLQMHTLCCCTIVICLLHPG